MNDDDAIALLCQRLGVPKRVFEGSEYAAGLASDQFDRVRSAQEAHRAKQIAGHLILPALEANLPELYWETAWICSPRGRVMKRRTKPVQITWNDTSQ